MNQQQVKTKNKTAKAVLISVIIAVLLFSAAAAVFIIDRRSLSRALKELDISQKNTVIRVLKHADDNEEILLDLASRYIQIGENTSAVQFLFHLLQNVNPQSSDAKALLTKAGIKESISFDGAVSYPEFDVTTEYFGTGYGGIDGVYCSDFDGYITYKLSSARPLSLSADQNGVYILDNADSTLKHISTDGMQIKIIKKDVVEFVCTKGEIYYIGTDGTLHTPTSEIKTEGEIYQNLRLSDGKVLCDIYDGGYNLLRTDTVN